VTDAVVCARNERARTIVPVVRALRKGARGRVILVDDGGNRGLWRARVAGATVITTCHTARRGKAHAMRTGLGYVTTPRVIFADADITGFTRDHARILAADNGGQIAGLRDNGSGWLGPLPPVTGERSVPADVARSALRNANGYGAESAINAEIGRRGLRAATFTMTGCTNPSREPVTRTRQVLAAMARHVLGLLQYCVAWIITAVS